MKLTSPYVLLILAAVATGLIFSIDAVYLRPQVKNQERAVLEDQDNRTRSAIVTSLQQVKDSLQQAGQKLAQNTEELQTGNPSLDNPSIHNLFQVANLELAWISDQQGAPLSVWSNDAKVSLKSLPVVKGIQEFGPELAITGLLAIGDSIAIVSPTPITSPQDRTTRYLWLAKWLDQGMLIRLAETSGARLTFVANAPLPQSSDISTGESVWTGFAIDGTPLGYFRAVQQVKLIHLQGDAARRMGLITLSMAVTLVLLVILGSQILITGPVVRLLRRLQKIDEDETIIENLTEGLHGEPRYLAGKLQSAFKELAYISKTDQLTELANRRHFEEMLDAFYEQARRYDRQLALITLDVDFFKAINDAGGHHAGDELLRIVAKAIEQACRKADVPGRLGGDEFAVLLPETTADQATAVAQRIAQTVATEATVVDGLELNVTLSIGIADLSSGAIRRREDLVALADRALYVAKERGRNCIISANELSNAPAETNDDSSKRNLLQKKLAGLNTQFKDLFLQAIMEIVELLEQRDHHMADHARKVQHYSVLIAQQMELPDRLTKRIEIAAMLHDVGMMSLPDSILLHPGQLDPTQLEQMRMHPLLSVQMMQGMEFLEQEIPAVRYHHERFDGKGYPDGLAGAAIPLAARILAVADCYDAMTSPRTFRTAMTPKQAVAEVQKGAGTQFDPAVVTALTAVWSQIGDRILDVPDLQYKKSEKGSPLLHHTATSKHS